jgi:hypothetical protein
MQKLLLCYFCLGASGPLKTSLSFDIPEMDSFCLDGTDLNHLFIGESREGYRLQIAACSLRLLPQATPVVQAFRFLWTELLVHCASATNGGHP